jgi:hypothetical protein
VSRVRWKRGVWCGCGVKCGGMGMVSMGFDSVAFNSIATLTSFFG